VGSTGDENGIFVYVQKNCFTYFNTNMMRGSMSVCKVLFVKVFLTPNISLNKIISSREMLKVLKLLQIEFY
jgi:hypothetical protein